MKEALSQSGGNLDRALRVDSAETRQPQKEKESPLLIRRAMLADRCLSHVLRGVLICLPIADSSDEATEPCHVHFSRALEEVAPLMERAPGLKEVLESGGSPPSTKRWDRLDAGDAAWMSCAASAALWRSISRPESEEDALAVPAALSALTVTDGLERSTLFALSDWTRAVLFAQVPAALGGQPLRASKHFGDGLRKADVMVGFVAALQARYLCTSMQDYPCFVRAKARALSSKMFPGVAQVAKHHLEWVEAQKDVLFPNDLPNDLPEDSSQETPAELIQ